MFESEIVGADGIGIDIGIGIGIDIGGALGTIFFICFS